jgi:hypothetical protein
MKIYVVIVAGMIAIALAGGWKYYGEDFIRIYQLRRYPSIRAESKLSADIEKENHWRRYQAALKRYRKVEGMLDRAEKGGRKVVHLRPRLPKIATYMERGNFQWANIHMNSIEMHLGRRPPREDVKLLNVSDFGTRLKSPKGKRVKRRRRRKRKSR